MARGRYDFGSDELGPSETPLEISPQGAAVPTASSLAIQDNSASGTIAHIKNSPASSSSAVLLKLEQDANSGNSSYCLELIENGSGRFMMFREGATERCQFYESSDKIIIYGKTGMQLGTGANCNLELLPGGTGITIVGDAGSTSHSLAANDDLLVTGNEEVNGSLYADGHFFPPTVTYATDMNTNVAGTVSEIVYCSTDSKAYVCTTSGAAGSAVWAALN